MKYFEMCMMAKCYGRILRAKKAEKLISAHIVLWTSCDEN